MVRNHIRTRPNYLGCRGRDAFEKISFPDQYERIIMTEAIVANSTQDRETRMRFMRIDTKTGELLREFWKVVEPALPTVLEGFYQHVTREPELARMIGNDIPRLKAAQRSHWSRLFNGRFDQRIHAGRTRDRPHPQQDRTGAALVYRRLQFCAEPAGKSRCSSIPLETRPSLCGAHGGEFRRDAGHGHRDFRLSGSDAGGASEAAG